MEDMQITADPSSGVVFCETVKFTLAVTTNQATTVDITWTPDDRLQQQRGAQPETRTLSFSAAQTVQDVYTVNLGVAHTGEQQKGTVTVTVSAPHSDSGKQATGSFDLLCEPG
ncbi:hypothetical protein [Streptomyces sp. CC0208]|uniref:hypothetical protein n=1 Tax=Streptomyces sp. CC0208 TaxID=2306165 RepID=UPI0001802DBF|nr:hypothetical protein [Streptomyces sp. CC0208]